MRIAVALLAMLIGIEAAVAQNPSPQTPKPPAAAPKPAQPAAQAPKPADAKPAQPAAQAAPKPAPAKPAPAASVTNQSLRDAYAALPLNDKLAIQADLIWSGHYNGTASGEFNDRAIAAVKAFQKSNKAKETGILNPQERAALTAAVKEKQEQIGWRLIEDAATGARLGIPAKLAPQANATKAGTRWTSPRNEVQVETMRVREPGTTLAAVFEQQKKEPAGRKVEYNVLRPDFFVVSGLQGLKKFYVRGHIKDNEVRTMTVLYDQAMDGAMGPVVVAMSNVFLAFPPVTGPPPKRKVEYATGIVVTKSGDVVASRQATDGCEIIVIAGRGNADRVATDESSDLALLRIYGARDLAPIALAAEAPKSTELILVGIADPQAQTGGSIVSTTNARLGNVSGSAVTLAPMPELGFAGAAAIDGQGQFVGTVELRPQISAGASQAALIPAATIRKFLESRNVASGSGRANIEQARGAVVRVICVRK